MLLCSLNNVDTFCFPFLFDMALASEKYPGQFTTADGDYVEPLAYDVSRISDIGDDSLARKILKRTY